MIQRADNNGDGDVDFAEFCELMCVPLFPLMLHCYTLVCLAIISLRYSSGADGLDASTRSLAIGYRCATQVTSVLS